MGENLEWLTFVQKFWVILVVLLLGFVQSLEFLKKSWNLQSKCKIEVRSGKMVKVWSFSFSKLQQVLTREYFSHSQIPFNLVCSKGIYYNHRMTSFRTLYVCIALWLPYVCSASMKKSFVPAFFKASINPWVWILDPNICTNPVL